MKIPVLLSLSCASLLFATDYQEISLDKLKNKKVYSLSVDEFEAIKKQEEQRKQSLVVEKTTLPNKVEEVVIENDAPIMPVESKEVKKEVVAKEPVKEHGVNLEQKTQNNAISQDSNKVNIPQPQGIVAEISSLQLDSGINYFLSKYKDLTVFEFEQSKSILYEKIKLDKRFDQEMINSINILALNKVEFIDFLSEVKNSIVNR